MAAGMIGPGIESARHLGTHHGLDQLELVWCDGVRATLLVGGGAWLPFHATVVHQQSVEYFEVAPEGLYRALLEKAMPYLSGAVDQPPLPYEELIEPELAALAARVSMQRSGAWVRLAELTDELAEYDGESFANAYRAAKLGTAK
jgi:hypothetical protein